MNEIDTDAIRAGVHGGALAQYPSLAMADEIDRLRGQVQRVEVLCDATEEIYAACPSWADPALIKVSVVRAALAAEPADFAWCPHEQIDDGGECYSCGCVLPIEELTTAGASPVVSTPAEPRRRCGPWTETSPGVSTCQKCGDINFNFEDDDPAAGATGSTSEPPEIDLQKIPMDQHPAGCECTLHILARRGCALSHPHAATKRCPG